MTPGAIRVDRVSRRFRVHPQEARTLKELIVARGRTRGTDVWALRDVSFTIDSGEAVGLVGRNGSGKTTLLKLLGGIIRSTSGRVEVGGRVGALLELGAGFHPDFTGRENVYVNASIHGLSRRAVRERLDEIVAFAELEDFIDLPVRTYSSGMAMRLGFAVAAHLEADVLLLDEVFAVGDEEFQRKCFGKIAEFKAGGGTIVFVSHDAAAVERLCRRTVLLRGGSVAFDGPTHEALVRYGRQLAAERDPAERRQGLREWGSGEARVDAVELVDPEGDRRLQFAPDEPFVMRVRVAAERRTPPPRIVYEIRGDAGVVVAVGTADLAELGWPDDRGLVSVRYELERLPLADGRYTVRLGLVDAVDGHPLHQVDDAASFVVYSGVDGGGVVRLDGRWERDVATAAEPSLR